MVDIQLHAAAGRPSGAPDIGVPLFQVAMSPQAHLRVADVLASGYIGQGPQVELLERELESRLPSEAFGVVTTNSCTSALDLAFELVGLGPGDEVISTPMTCIATNVMLLHRGCEIRWADCDPRTGHMEPASAKALMSKRTRAIVVVDWGGEVSDIEQLRQLGIPIVQDAAQSLVPIATQSSTRDMADYVCWSFQATKLLTTGDGGALVSRDQGAVERARRLRWFGIDRVGPSPQRLLNDVSHAGFKYQMNDIAAAIGRSNLGVLATLIERQLANGKVLDSVFADSPYATPPQRSSSRWMFTLLVDQRDAFMAEMAKFGIETSWVHARNDQYSAFSRFSCSLPGVDHFSVHNVAIPCGWWLTEDEVRRVGTTALMVAEELARRR